MERSCAVIWSTVVRVSRMRARSETIRNICTASSAASAPAHSAEAITIGRSRRNGSLERLIGTRILIHHRLQVPHQAGIERAGRSKPAAQSFHRVLPIERQSGRESAQDQLAYRRGEFILHIGEGGVEDRANLLFTHLFQCDAA